MDVPRQRDVKGAHARLANASMTGKAFNVNVTQATLEIHAVQVSVHIFSTSKESDADCKLF